MSDLAELLQVLAVRRIRVWLDGETLRYEAPAGAMDGDIKAALLGHKPEMIKLLMEKQQADARRTAMAAAGDDQVDGTYALAPEQEQLYRASRIHGANAATLTLPFAVRLSAGLDVARLTFAVEALIRRHDALRTVYESNDRSVRQRVLPDVGPSLERVTVDEPLDRVGDVLNELIDDRVNRPFDLGHGAPFRITLFHLPHDSSFVLLVCVHHIAADGMSAGILLKDLQRAYEGRELVRPDGELRYVDFVRQRGSAARIEAITDEYAAALRGAPPIHSLPVDFPRPVAQTFQGAHFVTRVEEAACRRSLALGRQHGVSLFTVLYTAFAVTISRLSGSSDVVLGMPVNTRPSEAFQGVVGCFVNMVAVRACIDDGAFFEDVLRDAHRALTKVHHFAAVTLDRVTEALGIGHSPGHAPLFQLTIGMQPGRYDFALPGVRCTEYPLRTLTSRYDLGLDLRTVDGGLHARWEYDRSLFRERTVQSFAECFREVLDVLPEDSRRRVGRLGVDRPLRRAAETDRSRPVSLKARFAAICRAHANDVALVFRGNRLSYTELSQAARNVESQLRARGIGRGATVGLTITQSVSTYVAMLAIMRLDAAYVPMDLRQPGDVMEGLARRLGIRLILCDESEATSCRSISAVPVAVHSDLCVAPDGTRVESTDAGQEPDCDWPLYIMTTSGSAGSPKAVVVTREAVARLANPGHRFCLTPASACLQAASLAFDAATYEIWGTWLCGGRLEVVERERLLSISELDRDLARRDVHTAFFTTALFNRFADAAPSVLRNFKRVLFGGEPVSLPHVLKAARACPDLVLVHMYGPTENTTFSTCHEVEGKSLESEGTLSIGRSFEGDFSIVVNKLSEPVPPGAIGELLVGGAGVALGYFGDPRLTAEKFVPSPIGAPGSRMYRTGDFVRVRENGEYDFMRRADDQVKVNGYRVELSEVEQWLCLDPGVAQAAAVVRPSPLGTAQLVAYVVPKAGYSSSPIELRRRAFERAPSYLRPHSVCLVDALPLNNSGKVDRAALLRATNDERVESGFTGAERTIADVWKETAGIVAASPDDDFFALGGDSLAAVAVCAALEAKLGVEVTATTFFASSTPATLAQAVKSGKRSVSMQELKL